ncbi:MAG TPA: hypothetical protein VLJ17_02440 [Xanthobacteraceae bacterium]|nr:hypothetical protein [Xanthobacteraceae bacterium]
MKITLSDDLSVDAVEYASRANAILGIRDSGKTYTATLLAEQLFIAGVPSFAFDPIGRWRFLKTPNEKGGRGFPFVVAGGAKPDLDLTPESAPKLIRAAMAAGVSMVIDLYSVHLSKADWRKIVRSSIETILYEGEGHGQRHVFLEEAAEFIPQKPYDGETYAAIEKLARMGGNIGVGLTLVNQRAEEVNKAVLELCDNLLLHRQRGKNSLLSLRKWLDAGNVDTSKEISKSLADLPTGECWAWFKDEGDPRRIHIARKQSFDPNRRTLATNKSGPTPGAVDVSAFVEDMKAALAGKPVAATAPIKSQPKPKEEPDVKESEARALREENARLRDRLGQLEATSSSPPAPPAATKSNATAATDMDAIYAEVKRRLLQEPSVLRVALVKPEIEIAVKRHVVEMDGASQRGRFARLIASGFFDDGATNTAVRAEMKRTGGDMAPPTISKFFDEFTTMGFLSRDGTTYTTVAGMKANVVEREAA